MICVAAGFPSWRSVRRLVGGAWRECEHGFVNVFGAALAGGWIMRLWLLFGVLAGSFLSAATVPGDTAMTRFTRYGLEDGLSQTIIYDILQDRQGFLWIATQDGLDRFDGYDFRVFKNLSDDPNSLTANTVTDLQEDGSGHI